MKKTLLFLLFLFPILIFGQNTTKLTAQEHFEKGMKHFKKERYNKAIVEFDSAIVKDPLYVEPYAYKAFSYYKLKNLEKTKEWCDLTLAVEKGYAEIYNLRGLARHELGDENGACDDWEMAVAYGFNDSFRMLKEFCPERVDKMKGNKKSN